MTELKEKIKLRIELLNKEKEDLLIEYAEEKNSIHRAILAERNARISFELKFLNELNS